MKWLFLNSSLAAAIAARWVGKVLAEVPAFLTVQTPSVR